MQKNGFFLKKISRDVVHNVSTNEKCNIFGFY